LPDCSALALGQRGVFAVLVPENASCLQKKGKKRVDPADLHLTDVRSAGVSALPQRAEFTRVKTLLELGSLWGNGD